MPKVIIVSFSLTRGGASIAANRFRRILNKSSNIDVESINQDNAGLFQLFKRVTSLLLSKLQFDNNPIKHSLNLFSFSPVLKSFNNTQNILHHFNWINNDTLSVFDFNKIPSGSIISLHDEWLYCGSEHHYNIFDQTKDFSLGYRYFKKGVLGIHWNSLIWKVKYKKLAHRDDIIYTVPSSWMLKRAQSSLLLKKSNIKLLPNPIDTEVFRPCLENEAVSFKNNLKIDNECFVIVFPTVNGNKNKLKGLHLLNNAFKLLQSISLNRNISKIVLIDFGGQVGEGKLHGFRNISIGHIHNTSYLAKLYSSADFVVIPSMIESFGQVAAEALSCCTPVVCFDTSGLKDIVLNRHTGLVAKSLSALSLSEQLKEMITISKEARLKMGQDGRRHIMEKFSFPIVSKQYLDILKDGLKLKSNHNS